MCVCEEREGRGEVRGRREGEGVDGNIYIGSNCPTMYGSLDGLISLDISHDFTTIVEYHSHRNPSKSQHKMRAISQQFQKKPYIFFDLHQTLNTWCCLWSDSWLVK